MASRILLTYLARALLHWISYYCIFWANFQNQDVFVWYSFWHLIMEWILHTAKIPSEDQATSLLSQPPGALPGEDVQLSPSPGFAFGLRELPYIRLYPLSLAAHIQWLVYRVVQGTPPYLNFGKFWRVILGSEPPKGWDKVSVVTEL